MILLPFSASAMYQEVSSSGGIDWTTIIMGILGLLGSGGGLKAITVCIEKYNSTKSKKAMEDIAKIYDCMQDIIDNTPINRVLVLATHNDGSEIKPGTKLFTSVLYEKLNGNFKSVKGEYQNIPLDAEYLNMLVELLNKERVVMHVPTAKDGLLKSIYEKEGVKYSKVIYLADSKRKKIWYLSCATDCDIQELNTYDSNLIKKNSLIIGGLLKKHNL